MRNLFRLIPLAALLLGLAPAPAPAQSSTGETIAIIGTGNLGGTLGKRWAEAGHTIVYGSRTPDSDEVRRLVEETGGAAVALTPAAAAARAELILLAVPAGAGEEVVRGLGALAGKILIEPMNSLTIEDGYAVAPSDPRVSIAERIQAVAPDAIVVKAFNTLNYSVMEDPALAGGPVTVPIAGDDAEAKRRVARLVTDVGLEPLDVGPLPAARYLEEMLRLHWGFRFLNPGVAFDYHLRVHPHPEGY